MDYSQGEDHPPKYTPTPEEIAEKCAAYQETWDEAEHRRRAGLAPPSHWTPPVVRTVDVAECVREGRKRK